MRRPLEVYEREVLDRICAVCVDRKDDGSCGLDPELECAVKTHLPELLDAISGVTSEQTAEYVKRIRDNVCAVCVQGAPDDCDVRDKVDCPLDRYLPLVVEAVEAVERERGADPPPAS